MQSSATGTGIRRHLRLAVRLVCLIVATLCLWPVASKEGLLPLVPAMSVLVTVASLLASHTFQPLFTLGLIIGLVGLFRHRWFCRWMCPTGLCMDCAGCLGRYFKRKPSQGFSFGRWLVALTVGGAIVGYPLFLWLDPLALFSGLFMAADSPNAASAWISNIVFAGLLIGSILRPNLWCGRLCPLGALQDMLAQSARWVRFLCNKPASDVAAKADYPVARRTVLGMGLGLAGASIVRLIDRKHLRQLRPPGAVDESTFTGLCTRCGNCVRACPPKIIARQAGHNGWAGLLTPVLSFEKDYCRDDCIDCTKVCPSGAITRIPLDAKQDIKIGLPHVDMNVCLLGEDTECSACRRWCPYEAIRYVFSETDYTLVPVVDPKMCNGCGACQVACPTSPVKAIKVITVRS